MESYRTLKLLIPFLDLNLTGGITCSPDNVINLPSFSTQILNTISRKYYEEASLY